MLVLRCCHDMYELKSGENLVGTDESKCHVVLHAANQAEPIHAIIDVTKSMQDAVVRPLGRVLVNSTRVTTPTSLAMGDVVSFGAGEASSFKFDALVTHTVAASIEARNRTKAMLTELKHVEVPERSRHGDVQVLGDIPYMNDVFVSAQLLDSAKQKNQSFDIDSDDSDDDGPESKTAGAACDVKQNKQGLNRRATKRTVTVALMRPNIATLSRDIGLPEASLQARHEMERIEWQKELSAVKHEIDRLHGLQQKPRTCEASTQCHITEEARPRSSDPTYTNNRKIQITKRSASTWLSDAILGREWSFGARHAAVVVCVAFVTCKGAWRAMKRA
ncbi:hypothetical protein, variant [Aphanomyces invadans]|uniref:FHA domain-containing protein n=1 Tax=Aphanomyces invadans TaxID=157072 RepID=A0A024TJM4_9STRA|nr:hypothetical protein, variant [Aphanomyces invadans]ETV94248.1 hypothetical protein, variant [Aphanomyces invadans]|eukprot:XP_008877009.1 hypothetical protein, variant [Aphanomyces invadans]